MLPQSLGAAVNLPECGSHYVQVNLAFPAFKMPVFWRRNLGKNESKNLLYLGLGANLFGLQQLTRQVAVPPHRLSERCREFE